MDDGIVVEPLSPDEARVPTRAARSGARYVVASVGLSLLVAVYVVGAYLQGARANTDINAADQSAYIDYAIGIAETGFNHLGDRNRMPVFPFLASFLYDAELTEQQFFERGKLFNIGLSIVLLFALYGLQRLYWPAFESAVVTLIASFTIFIYFAPYFTAEVLFYFANFCLFVTLWEMLTRPRLWLAVAGGVIAGLAYLTKASVPPALLAFGVFFVARTVVAYRWPHRDSPTEDGAASGPSPVARLAMLGVFAATFLGIIGPYLMTSKEVFGRYFYNRPTTFYMWYDSWDEVLAGTWAHGEEVGWPTLPPEEIPSLKKYVRDHTLGEIITRPIRGAVMVTAASVVHYGYLKYLVVYALLSAWLAIQYRARLMRLVNPTVAVLGLFVLAYFSGYLLLIGWYAPVSVETRFVLAHYLPALFVLFKFLQHPGVRALRLQVGRYSLRQLHVHQFVLGMLALELLFEMPYHLMFSFGASQGPAPGLLQ